MEGFTGHPATGGPHNFGNYGPNPHQRMFRHHNVDESPLTMVALGFGALFLAAFIWYFITPLFRTIKVHERDTSDVEARMNEGLPSSASAAHRLVGYDSTTGLYVHNGMGLRGRYPVAHGSCVGTPLDAPKFEYDRNQPYRPLTSLPTLPFLSYHAEGHPTVWLPPPAYSSHPETPGIVSVPRPVHMSPNASAELAAFFMRGQNNPVDYWTIGDSGITLSRNDWRRRSLSYPAPTVEVDNPTPALRRNLSDPGRYPTRYAIPMTAADPQNSSRGEPLTASGPPPQPHDSRDAAKDNRSNDSQLSHDVPREPVESSHSTVTIRPCSASHVSYYPAPTYTAFGVSYPEGLAYYPSHYPFGSAFANSGSAEPLTSTSMEPGLGYRREIFWGPSENGRGQSGVHELHHREIGVEDRAP